jgi:hypothetical protein
VRELLPFKEAQRLLKKAGIDLPSYYNRKRPTAGRGAGGSSKAAETRRTNEEAKRRIATEREAEFRKRVLKAAFPKIKATLTKDVLREIVDSRDVSEVLELLFDHRDLRKLAEADLVRLLIAEQAIGDVGSYAWGQAKHLHELAKSAKVDTSAIRRQVAKDITGAAGETDEGRSDPRERLRRPGLHAHRGRLLRLPADVRLERPAGAPEARPAEEPEQRLARPRRAALLGVLEMRRLLRRGDEAMTFTLGEVLSITHGKLLCPIDRVYEILNFMTGDDLYTHQLGGAWTSARRTCSRSFRSSCKSTPSA